MCPPMALGLLNRASGDFGTSVVYGVPGSKHNGTDTIKARLMILRAFEKYEIPGIVPLMAADHFSAIRVEAS
jgi:hypothetical protein